MPEIQEGDGNITRRSALQISAAGCTGAIVASSIPTQVFSPMQISIEQWRQLIGQEFVARQKSFEETPAEFRRVVLRLVEVEELTTKPQPGCDLPRHVPPHSISLCFQGQMRTQLPSATYDVEHEKIGTKRLFINEIQAGEGEHVRVFESILN
jgi:hypothetical protein